MHKFKMTQKVEDMAAEFLLTFLAVLVQLGLPTRQNQISGKEFESGYAMYRSVTLSYYCSVALLYSCFDFQGNSLSLSLALVILRPMSELIY